MTFVQLANFQKLLLVRFVSTGDVFTARQHTSRSKSVYLSVCLSVTHCQNDSCYDHAVFTGG